MRARRHILHLVERRAVRRGCAQVAGHAPPGEAATRRRPDGQTLTERNAGCPVFT
jgi:hypothetical protein